ncbi:MAG: flagellar hook assembly protein FlgD [Rhodospirillaceae bacterium]
MDVSALLGSTTSSKADASKASLGESFDTFLTLLTTQLKYQDPLEPMDSTEFTNQLVQFTGVEQSIRTNKQLEDLLALQSTNQGVAAIGYIGNTVQAVSDVLPLIDGSAEITYALPENAEKATILIFNASGQLVRSADGNAIAGKHSFTWDGQGSNGETLPDGAYTFAVAAQNADKKTLEVPTAIVGTVTGTQTDGNAVQLLLGAVPIDISNVISVSQPRSNS